MADTPATKPNTRPATKRAAPSKPAAKPATAKSSEKLEKSEQTSQKPKKTAKPDRIKFKKASFDMLETEQEALLALKHVLRDALGKKVKKNQLLRVAVRLLLKHPQTKVKSELAALIVSGGTIVD